MATPEQIKDLKRFYKDWRNANGRLEMAQQTLAGAQNDATLKEARFKGAAELVFGSTDVAFTYDEGKDALTFTLPNREARRTRRKK